MTRTRSDYISAVKEFLGAIGTGLLGIHKELDISIIVNLLSLLLDAAIGLEDNHKKSLMTLVRKRRKEGGKGQEPR